MVYLITGGAGFIGSHLCQRLLAQGEQVLALDNLSTGTYRNIAGLKSNPNFSLYISDIRDSALLESLVERCDGIFHLAAAVGVKLIIDQPVQTLESNILGTHRVLSVAAKYNRQIVITSTSEVYGKPSKASFAENDDLVLGPTTKKRWGYACSKMADEFLGLAFYEEKGLPVIITRLFNTVGPRQTGRYGMVIPTFVRQALRGEPITVFGSGAQSRCFIHVREVVEALIKLTTTPEASGEVVNLGGTQEITIDDLARTVKEITGSKSEIVHVPYDLAYEAGFEDIGRRVPDISKAKKLIGFSPRIGLSQIVTEVAEAITSEGRL